jgi:DNA-binding Lrp family transcriptional regulator
MIQYHNFNHQIVDIIMQIDNIDRSLITLLMENARRPVADLARDLGLARSTVQARLDRLETQGVIRGYSLKLGQSFRAPLQATALLSIEPRSAPSVLQVLKTMNEVDRVFTTSGRFDMQIELSAQSTEVLDQALDKIGAVRGVKSSESLIHLSTKIDRQAG